MSTFFQKFLLLFALPEQSGQELRPVDGIAARERAAQPLRVPLHGEDGQRFMCDRLDRAVGSASEDLQSFAQGFDGLMVGAVDREARAIQCAQQARRGMNDVQAVAAALLGVAQNVPVKRAAEKDIDELQAAADADDGLSPAQKFVNERKLAFVARFINVRRAADRAAVKTRVDVAPAGKQQNVRVLRRFGERRADQRERIFVIFQAYR